MADLHFFGQKWEFCRILVPFDAIFCSYSSLSIWISSSHFEGYVF